MKHFNKVVYILGKVWGILGAIILVPLMIIVYFITLIFYGKRLAVDMVDGFFEGIK